MIDVDLYTEELAEGGESDSEPPGGAARDDVFQLIGVRLTRAQQARPLRAFRGRFPWLLCNVGGGVLAAVLSGIYEDELNWNRAVLALFIPVVLTLAESVAMQSATLTLDALRGGSASWADLVRRLRHEAATGAMLGLATGMLVAVLAFIWQGLALLFLIVLGGIGLGVTGAAIAGLTVPYLLRLFRRDPQVAAGPIALAVADMLTLLAYFNLARLLT